MGYFVNKTSDFFLFDINNLMFALIYDQLLVSLRMRCVKKIKESRPIIAFINPFEIIICTGIL